MNIHSTKTSPTQTETGSKRELIIHATIKLISEYGFHGTPISMIAQEAGVGAGTIYRYFKDKDTLVLEIFTQVNCDFKQTLLHGYDANQAIRDRFIHLCRGIFLYGIQNPYEFKFIEQFYNSPYGTSLRREKLFCNCGDTGQALPLEQVFAAGQAQQVIKELPLAALIALAIGPIIFLVKDSIAGLIQLDEATINNTLAACWDAIQQKTGPNRQPVVTPSSLSSEEKP
ncbi:MAG: TetR/AcrR family transcriptional regulator [Desulfocapsaceae bacterium]|nr:TetR/AcrR family transcriptional regulator [Desulfocapsaceae bacterium]